MRWPHPSEAEIFIRNELVTHGIPFKLSKNDFCIPCPVDNCPSDKTKYKMEIRKDGRMVHCWVCNWAGTWQTVAKYLGVTAFNKRTSGLSTEVASVDMFERLALQLEDSATPHSNELPSKELSDWNGVGNNGEPWRGLTVEFLRELPAYSWHQQTKYGSIVKRILLPFYQLGELKGYSGRRLDNSKILRYYNAEFSSASEIFFPYDYVLNKFKSCKIVLVEGPIDALYLIQNGIPALSILGTPNWSDYKRDLLVAANIKKVIICMDGDDAGRKTAPKIYNSLENIMDYVECLDLPDSLDPATLSIEQISWLHSHLEAI